MSRDISMRKYLWYSCCKSPISFLMQPILVVISDSPHYIMISRCDHDSFIVRSTDERILDMAMQDAYASVLSFLSDSNEMFKRKVSRSGIRNEAFLASLVLDAFPDVRKKAGMGLPKQFKKFRNPKLKFSPGLKNRMTEFMKKNWERDYYKESDQM